MDGRKEGPIVKQAQLAWFKSSKRVSTLISPQRVYACWFCRRLVKSTRKVLWTKSANRIWGQNLPAESDDKKGRQTPKYVPFWSERGKMQGNYKQKLELLTLFRVRAKMLGSSCATWVRKDPSVLAPTHCCSLWHHSFLTFLERLEPAWSSKKQGKNSFDQDSNQGPPHY